VFAKDAKVADSEESATEHALEVDTIIADLQELNLRCYPTEENLNVLQLIMIIIEQEKIIVSLELKAAEFIEAGISRYNNISNEKQETTKDYFIVKIQI